MKSSMLFLMTLSILVTSVSYNMEEKNNLIFSNFGEDNKNIEEKHKKNQKTLELLDLPTEMLSHIVDTVIDTGSLKDTRSVLLTNRLLATLVLNSSVLKSKYFSKRLCYAYQKKYSSWGKDGMWDLSGFKGLKRMRDYLDEGCNYEEDMSLLDDQDILNLINHISSCNIDKTLSYNTMLQNEISWVLDCLITRVRKRKLNINVENKEGLTLLMWIGKRPKYFGFRYTTLLEELLQTGADINYKNKDGKTCLDMVTPKQGEYIKKLKNKLTTKS